MIDPSGGGDYMPLVTLADVTDMTLQDLLDTNQLIT